MVQKTHGLMKMKVLNVQLMGIVFSIDGNDVKSCNSGSTSGGLKRYTSSLSGDTLTVTKS